LKSLFVSGSHNKNIGECKVVWPQNKQVKKGGDSQKKEQKQEYLQLNLPKTKSHTIAAMSITELAGEGGQT
jgi:hypothetical protein